MATSKNPIQFRELVGSPSVPSAGHRSIYAKYDGFYQMDASGNESPIGSGGGGTTDPGLLNRIVSLENQQKRVSREFQENFHNLANISRYTGVTFVGGASILKSTESVDISFNTDSDVDYTQSTNIAVENGSAKMEQLETLGGELVTREFIVNTTQQVQLQAMDTTPSEYSGGSVEVIDTSKLWFATGVDPNGRLWVFTSNHRELNNTIYGTIFNSDGSVFKTGIVLGLSAVDFSIQLGAKVSFDKFGHTYLIVGSKDDGSSTGALYGRGGTQSNNTNYGNALWYDVYQFDLSGELKYFEGFSQGYWKSTYFVGGAYTEVGGVTSTGTICLLTLPIKHCRAMFPREIDNANSNIQNQRIVYRYMNGSLEHYSTFRSDTYTGVSYAPHVSQIAFAHAGDVYITANPQASLSTTDFVEIKFNRVREDPLGTILVEEVPHTVPSTESPVNAFQTIKGLVYSEYSNHLYSIRFEEPNILKIFKYQILEGSFLKVKEASYTLTKPVQISVDSPHVGRDSKFMCDSEGIHITYIGKDEVTQGTSLRYIHFDYDCNMVVKESLIAYYSNDYIETHSVERVGNDLMFFYGVGLFNGDPSTHRIEKRIWQMVPTSISYSIYNKYDAKWYEVYNGGVVTMAVPTDTLKVKVMMESPQYKASPTVSSINLSLIDDIGTFNLTGEVDSTKLSAVTSSGKGNLTADLDLNEGTVEWFVSYDGGVSWNSVDLGQEFVFNFTSAPDFRVRAVLNIEDASKVSPVIRSYTLRTDSVVLHSDLEEVQINLMKTNFKIDSHTNASKNGLLKMTIDVFSDTQGINDTQSDYTFDGILKSVSGNYVTSNVEDVSEVVTSVLLTVDETLENGGYIEYFVSTDGGATFSPIEPNVKTAILNTYQSSQLVLKAVFNGDAKLNAWAWAWN